MPSTMGGESIDAPFACQYRKFGEPAIMIASSPESRSVSETASGLCCRYFHDDGADHRETDDYIEMLNLLRGRGGTLRIDRRGLVDYLTFGHSIGPRTLVEDIGMAFPEALQKHARAESPSMPGTFPDASGTAGSSAQWIRTVGLHLEEAIDRLLASSVRPALLLSGGYDSTLLACRIVARGQALSTWSVGFGPSDRGAGMAGRVAAWLGTRHRHLVLAPEAVAARLPATLRRLGLPSGNPSVMATDLAAETIAPEADVLFSGLGSDELFGGHVKHIFARYWPVMKYLAALNAWRKTRSRAGRRYAKRILDEFAEGYRSFYHLLTPKILGELTAPSRTPGQRYPQAASQFDLIGRDVFEIDQNCWLLSGILAQAARLADANGIRLALPFCDPTLRAAMQHLPLRYKVKGLTGKWILRQAYRGEIPAWVENQTRSGFSLPMDQWLRGPLKRLVLEYLNDDVVRSRGLFDPVVLKGLVNRHLEGRADISLPIWSLITLEVWFREFIDISECDK